jgi:hypothetical protein
VIAGIDFPPKAVIEFWSGDKKENGIAIRLDNVSEEKASGQVNEKVSATITVAAGVPIGNYRLVVLYPDKLPAEVKKDDNAVAAVLDNALSIVKRDDPPPPLAFDPEEFSNHFPVELKAGYTAFDKEETLEQKAIREYNHPDLQLRAGLDNYDLNRHFGWRHFALRGDARFGYDQGLSNGRRAELAAGLTPVLQYDGGVRLGAGLRLGYDFENSDQTTPAGPFAPSRRQHTFSLAPVAALESANKAVYLELRYRQGINQRDYYAEDYNGISFSETTASRTLGGQFRLSGESVRLGLGADYSIDETALPKRYTGSDGRLYTGYLYPEIDTYKLNAELGYAFQNNWDVSIRYDQTGSQMTGLPSAGSPQAFTDRRVTLGVTPSWVNQLLRLDLFGGQLSYGSESTNFGLKLSVDLSAAWRTTRQPAPTIFGAPVKADDTPEPPLPHAPATAANASSPATLPESMPNEPAEVTLD